MDANNTLYERYAPGYILSPGDILEGYLEPNGLTGDGLAIRCEIPRQHVHDILAGKAPVTQDIATRFEKALGYPAQYWINLETIYRDRLAQRGEEENSPPARGWVKPIVKIGREDYNSRRNKKGDAF
jgi:addiction module HigA family antidote